ncbi:MAG: helix-turn-helix transcriptional regulator [Oscillospiraceae bacterium]|nr:helix-turn-helix transcriptional regulator [Oscillospiraceae bacterium]
MDMIAIGSKIKEARERAHLTQEELAEIVDISPTHMSVIERGVKTPKLDTFVRIVNALNLSSDALLQDGIEHADKSIMAELSVRLGRLSEKEQNRILNAIRALTE